eukprot:7542981-Lingulodinium_polyedra.AAC.1
MRTSNSPGTRGARIANVLPQLLARWGVLLVRSRADARRDRHGGRCVDFVAVPATRPDDLRL